MQQLGLFSGRCGPLMVCVQWPWVWSHTHFLHVVPIHVCSYQPLLIRSLTLCRPKMPRLMVCQGSHVCVQLMAPYHIQFAENIWSEQERILLIVVEMRALPSPIIWVWPGAHQLSSWIRPYDFMLKPSTDKSFQSFHLDSYDWPELTLRHYHASNSFTSVT